MNQDSAKHEFHDDWLRHIHEEEKLIQERHEKFILQSRKSGKRILAVMIFLIVVEVGLLAFLVVDIMPRMIRGRQNVVVTQEEPQ